MADEKQARAEVLWNIMIADIDLSEHGSPLGVYVALEIIKRMYLNKLEPSVRGRMEKLIPAVLSSIEKRKGVPKREYIEIVELARGIVFSDREAMEEFKKKMETSKEAKDLNEIMMTNNRPLILMAIHLRMAMEHAYAGNGAGVVEEIENVGRLVQEVRAVSKDDRLALANSFASLRDAVLGEMRLSVVLRSVVDFIMVIDKIQTANRAQLDRIEQVDYII